MSSDGIKQLDRKLGFWSVFSISLGAMMGSGIFVLPGLAAGIAGPRVYLCYLLAGLVTMPALLSKAELATAMPVAGGTYVYIDRALGPWMGTITGLGTWFSLSSKIAFAMVGLGAYLKLLTPFPPLMFAIGMLVLLVGVNIVGVGKASGLQIAVVVFCILALSVLFILGVPTADPSLADPAFPNGFSGIVAGTAFVFVSYAGVTKVASIAEEVRDPEKNLPAGMLGAQLAAMVIYVTITWVITANTDYRLLAEDITPIATTGQALLGHAGMLGFACVSVVALISMSNAGLLATSRAPFAMSRDRMLPDALAKISDRFGTPWVAIIATGVLLVMLILFLPVTKLAKLASGFKIFIFTMVNIAVIVLRESGARWYQPPFRSPFYPWTQIIGILGGAWLLYALGMFGSMGIVASFVLGTVWYMVYGRKRVDRRSVFHHLWDEQAVIRATEQAEYEEDSPEHAPNVIVPIFGGEPAPARLIHLGATFREKGQLEVLRLEEVPESMMLKSHLDSDPGGELLRAISEGVGELLDIEVVFHDLVTHNAKRALQEHAQKTKSSWIVMEWPTRRELRFLVRHPLAWWIDHAPCDLVIFMDKGGPDDGETRDDFRRILVLAEPGPYDSLLVHVADQLAASQLDAVVTLWDPLSIDADDDLVDQRTAYHEQLASMCASPCISRIEKGEDPYKMLEAISEDHDVLLLGAGPERPIHGLVFSSVEDRMAKAAKCSVLKIKAPRHQVHHRYESRREDTEEQMILTPYLQHAALRCGLPVTKKADVFRQVGELLVSAGVCDEGPPIVEALLQREQRQNTALSMGVAISAPSVENIQFTQVVVCTLPQLIDYQSPGRRKVDVLVMVLAPRRERQVQLWVLERMARMATRTDLLLRLRAAKTEEAMREVLLNTSSGEAY